MQIKKMIIGVTMCVCGLGAFALSHTTTEEECVYVEQTERVDKFQVCENLLNLCAEDSFLKERGVERYKELQRNPTIPEYMELIAECCQEDGFYDVIASTDEWDAYIREVYEPAQNAIGVVDTYRDAASYGTWENAEGVKVVYEK